MSYDINSIESLSFKDGVRTRIQMYLGSDDLEGTYQALKEIINNSTDEALAGYGNKIEINVSEKENCVRVRDYGRGVPFGIREDGENVLVSTYSKSHTGGKFHEGAYKNASGLNGIGAKCVCLSSVWFDVFSVRDGVEAHAHFNKGELEEYSEFKSNLPNGTIVEFQPDKEVFHNGEIGYSYARICEDTKNISYLYKGITFIVTNNDTKESQTFQAKNGIIDFIKDTVKDPVHKTILYETASDGTDSVEIACQWGKGKEKSYVFVNGLHCPEGGVPVTGAKTAITKTMNSLMGKDFDGDKIRQNLVYVINCQVAAPSFANQTKSKINNASLRGLTSTAFTNALKNFKQIHSDEFKVVQDILIKVDRAEAAAERARNAILNHEKEMIAASKHKYIDSNKLRDARKTGENSMLMVVEGDSAGGSMSIGRQKAENGDHFGILQLRGKIINAFSNPIEDVLQSDVIKLLLQALGITYGQKYNSKKLRYGTVAIVSDADFDGGHIGLLIMTALQKLCPEFIQEGRLLWLKPPIYKLETKQKTWYYYSEEEMENRTQKTGNIIKYKGLGQMDSKDLKETMFNNQRLERLVPSDEGIAVLTSLMGPEVQPRKEFIQHIDFGGFNL